MGYQIVPESSDDYFVIIADEIDNTQRTLLHELVKRDAESWWHQYANVWVVKGGNMKQWRSNCSVIVPLPPASVIILALKQRPGGRWGVAGGKSGDFSWFRETLTPEPGVPGSRPTATRPERPRPATPLVYPTRQD